MSNEDMPLERLHTVFREHLYLPDTDIIDFTIAVAVANRLGGDPVWAFLVAPPSSGKTETLQSLTRLPEVHPMSSLTANTFLSGAKETEGGKPASLLQRLPTSSLLLLKDFGTVLAMREDARAEILGQLREIYDGSLVKEFGNGRTIRWEGRLGFIAGTTPAIDQHHSVIATLGERFLYFRVSESDRKAMGRRAASTRNESVMRGALQASVYEYMNEVEVDTRPELPDAVLERLMNVADIVTWARSAVYRDRFTRDIEVAPTKEAPGRFIKQLVSLWRALTVMHHPDPLAFVCRVALDSMPPARSAALTRLAAADVGSTNEIKSVTKLSTTANRRLLEDLEALDLIEVAERGGPGVASTWVLTPLGRKTWDEGFAGHLHPQYQGEGEREEETGSVDVAGASPSGWAALAAELAS